MSSIAIKTVRTIEEWLQCQHIRSAAFLHTEPYEEEFDGNDFEMVVHILARLGKIPAACMRLSLFSLKNGGVIHWGRLAMMPNIDSKKRLVILNTILDYAAEYSDNSGYRKSIAEVTDERLLRFVAKRGFKLTNEPSVRFGDRLFKKIARQNAVLQITAREKSDNDVVRRNYKMQ